MSQTDCNLCNQIDASIENRFGTITINGFDSLATDMVIASKTCLDCQNGLYKLWETALYQYRVTKDITNQKIALANYKQAYKETNWSNDTVAFDLGLTVLLREGYYFRNLEDFAASKKAFNEIITRVNNTKFYNYSIHETKNIAYQNLGNIEKKRGNWNKALMMYQYAIDDELEYAKIQNRMPVVFSIYAYLGEINNLKGNHKAAYDNFELSNQVLITKMKLKTEKQMSALVYQYLQRFLGQIKPAIALRRWEDVDRLFSIISGLPLLPNNSSNLDISLAKLDYNLAKENLDSIQYYFQYIDQKLIEYPSNKLLEAELLQKKIEWEYQQKAFSKLEISIAKLSELIRQDPYELDQMTLIVLRYKMLLLKEKGLDHEVINLLNEVQDEISQRLSKDLIFEDHIQSASQYYELLETGLDLLYTTKSHDYDLIFATIESIKSLKLLSTYRSSIKRMTANDSLVSEYKYLCTKVANLKRDRLNKVNDSGLSKQLFETEEALIRAKASLLTEDKVLVKQVTLETFRHILNPKEAYITLFSGKAFNYILTVDKDSASLHRTPTTTLKAITLKHFDLLSNPTNLNQLGVASQKLHSLLQLKHISPKIEHLKISGDNFTNIIPFETLVSEKGKYLVEKYNIHYTPSANLDYLINTSTKSENQRVGVFSPNFKDNELLFIPNAQQEVNAIKEYFATEVFENNDASISNFTSSIENFNLIHLITHGLALNDNPSQYYIAFSDSNNNETRLFYDDISALSMSADLVCLSACQTGKGENYIAEGSQSLSKNFMAAGCKSIISALWNISDQTSREIFHSFYSQLSKGRSKAKALTMAKREFIKTHTSEEKHPYYWAGLVLTGDSQSLKGSSININWPLVFGVFLFISFMIFGATKIIHGSSNTPE